MNNWSPYAPDNNPPPGIPKGYPYALNPNAPPMNPMYQNLPLNPNANNPGIGLNPLPNSCPYPPGSHSNPSYPPVNPSNPSYPPGNPSYPPSNPSYPYTDANSYPSTGPNPYPSSGSTPYASSGSMYPSTGPNPYPPTVPGPYQSTGSNQYPGSSAYGSTGVYPPAGSSPYPTPSSLANNSSNFPPQGMYPQSTPFNQGYPSGNHRNMGDYITGQGTIRDYPNFDPKVDAEVLRKAMKGFGTDEKAIINVLANRSNSQRVYISIAFKQLYGKDLIEDLKSELSGNFEQVILGLMMPLNEYLAQELHKAMSGIGTREDVLIEVLCTRTNQEIWVINEAYNRLYGKPLEEDIRSDTSGHFERLLVSACTGARSEAPADSMRAKETAEALYQAGAGQWGTDESVFNSILVAESFQQLAHTFYEYQKLTDSTVTQAIESEMSGDVKAGMLAIAKCVENRPFYFAEKLYYSMKGLGTDDDTLIRIVVSRCEIDMVQIKAEYERNYGKPLVDAITGDTSGDYKKILVALVNGM